MKSYTGWWAVGLFALALSIWHLFETGRADIDAATIGVVCIIGAEILRKLDALEASR